MRSFNFENLVVSKQSHRIIALSPIHPISSDKLRTLTYNDKQPVVLGILLLAAVPEFESNNSML